MHEVVIGSPAFVIYFDSEPPNEWAEVRLTTPQLNARHPVYDPLTFHNLLADFFEQLDRDWRGWPGVRTFESFEQDFRIRATHDGRVHLRAELGPMTTGNSLHGPNAWAASLQVTLEAGEQLRNLVAEVVTAVRP